EPLWRRRGSVSCPCHETLCPYRPRPTGSRDEKNQHRANLKRLGHPNASCFNKPEHKIGLKQSRVIRQLDGEIKGTVVPDICGTPTIFDKNVLAPYHDIVRTFRF